MNKRIVSLLLLFASSASVIGVGASPANAAAPVLVRSIDATNSQLVTVTMVPSLKSDSGTMQVSENGRPVEDPSLTTAASANRPTDLAIVVDTSAAMGQGTAMNDVKNAIRQLIALRSSNEQIAIVSAGGSFSTPSSYTSSVSQLNAAVNQLSASGDSQLWNGVRTAAALPTTASSAETNIVVFASGDDTVKAIGDLSLAQNKASEAGAAVFGIVAQSATSVVSNGLSDLAAATGGTVQATGDSSDFVSMAKAVQSALADEQVLTYSSASTGAIDIGVTVGGNTQIVHTAIGQRSVGAQVAAVGVAPSKAPSILFGAQGELLLALGALLAVAVLTFAVLQVVGREHSQLSGVLQMYHGDFVDEHTFKKVSDYQLLAKAIAKTEKVAEKRGVLEQVRERLNQANLPLKPGEFMFFSGVLVVVAALLGLGLFGVLGALGGAVIFAFLPFGVTTFLARHRRKKFESQLPEMLQLLAGTLRAGYALVQGLDVLAKQMEDPMQTELTRTISESRLGRPIEEALAEVSARMRSNDFETVVTAIEIQREFGGNLAELLTTVKKTLVARKSLRGEIKALTAEGRISAVVLVSLPPAVGLLIELVNPGYMAPMHSMLGEIILGGAGVSMAIGWVVMRKLMQVEV
jgi:tight adherence protein B